MLITIIILYLFALYPNNKRKQFLKPYEEKYICHRGLFNNIDVPENCLTAFKKAVDNNYGIELDVQLTSDNKLVVFHDSSLERMTGVNLKLTDCTFEQLNQYKLLNINETIPLFEDVLKILNKDTPLIIEIKAEGRYIETTKRVVELMKDYDGIYNIESFNPNVVYYLKRNHPQIIRGQLSYDYLSDKNSKVPFIIKFILTNLLFNFINKPDYIAYDVNAMNKLSFKIVSKLYKTKCVAWTVKSQKQLDLSRKYYDCFIFDSFIPN